MFLLYVHNSFVLAFLFTFPNLYQCLSSITVVGLSGGVAENIALKLSFNNRISLLLDSPPQSDLIKKSNQISIYVNEEERKEMALAISAGSTNTKVSDLVVSSDVIIALGDDGKDLVLDSSTKDQEGKLRRTEQLLFQVATSLDSKTPTRVKSVIYATSVANDPISNSKGSLFRKRSVPSIDQFRSWHNGNSNSGFGVLKYGKLIGGVPGKEPIPFLTMPLLEPELHPSYILNSLILTPLSAASESSANQYAESEICTRGSLCEAVCRLTEKALSSSGKGVEATGFIQSITGPIPSERDWEGLFSRLLSSSSRQEDVQLLQVEMEAINKPTALGNWLVDNWFPSALIDADAATILTGARPVRASKVSTDKDNEVKIKILWEDLQSDLTVMTAGALQIEVSPRSNPPAITVKRLSKGGALPGETMIVDKLVEAINKSVYKKQFCIPKVDK